MVYMGGKFRIAKDIVRVMSSLTSHRLVVEPFCGGCAMTAALCAAGYRVSASDGNRDIVAMWKHAMDGGAMPGIVTETDYAEAMANEDYGPTRGFVLTACSYGGKYKGGYARGNRNYAACGVTAVTRDVRAMKGRASFAHGDYKHVDPRDCALYCDIPYGKAAEYQHHFIKDEFIEWAIGTHPSVDVFVSEWSMPEPFVQVWEKDHFSKLNNQNDGMTSNTERLYVLRRGTETHEG